MTGRLVSRDGVCSSADPAVVALWDEIGARMDCEQTAASSALRAQGVKAEHPDDGWVNRTQNKVHLCYPRFNDRPEVGDLIALGDPRGGYRIVRVTEIEHGGIIAPMTYYHFTEVTPRPTPRKSVKNHWWQSA